MQCLSESADNESGTNVVEHKIDMLCTFKKIFYQNRNIVISICHFTKVLKKKK